MKHVKNDAIRHALIQAGHMDRVHEIEAELGRDDLGDRAAYRAALEKAATEAGVLDGLGPMSEAPPYG